MWGFSKSYTGNRTPIDDYERAARNFMRSNGRKGGNDEPHQHIFNPVSEPHPSTRDNFGYLKAATVITGPVKGKEINN